MKVKYDKILDALREQDVSQGGDASTLEIVLTCTALEQIGDVVYVSNDNTVARASAADISTARVVGFIKDKPTSTSATVILSGVVDVLSGLTTGSEYFLSTASGAITTTVPTGAGEVVVNVGKALNSTTLLVGLSNTYLIRT